MTSGSPQGRPVVAAADGRALPGAGSARALIEALHALREAPHGADHWAQVAAGVQRLCRAQSAWVLVVTPAATAAANNPTATDWRCLGASTPDHSLLQAAWAGELQPLIARATQQGFASCPGRTASGVALWWAAVRLERVDGGWLLLAIPDHERPQLNELLLRAQLVADMPAPAEGGTAHADAGPAAAPAAQAPVEPAFTAPVPTASTNTGASAAAPLLAAVSAEVVAQARFGPATLALVNGLAAHCEAVQVVLGWRHGSSDRVHTVAISHRDKFDRFSTPLALTDDALDEALDAEGGVALAPPAAGVVNPLPTPAHDLLQASLGPVHLLSLPLRRGDAAPRAVLLLAFDAARPPDAALREQLQQTMAPLLPWLETLHQQDRAWPLRLGDALRERARALLGPSHLGLKTSAALIALLLLYALIAHWDYRVSANGQLATDSTRIISAQFDGRIDEARLSAGDTVQEGTVLASLDTRELRQQETDAQAERKRFLSEADRARAANALADLEVATARAAQAGARLARLTDLLAQAEHRAPFDGVVVEGERKELQGAPVRKGDKLYRLARVEGLYATLMVPERDAALVAAGATGELVLVSRPDHKIPLKVLAVIPVAQTRGQEGNYFMLRAELLQAPQAWWRPGMSGAARIDAGERQVAWILTHRLIDSLRLMLWW
ncbi:MAG: hypothetical protein A3E25_09850 [Burkholderiales bacterium RIFCSPHIGHO2_12_FULL_69_20]|nr:MAG: hypothetical protein A3E25_09850 [Burkholderiales bacterium RIFCSPHIGHO2_12_FULL_69_20]